MNGPIAQFWLERTPDKREVTGSSPVRPTRPNSAADSYLLLVKVGGVVQRGLPALHITGRNGGCSSAGRAPALHAGGHRFDPVHLHHFTAIKSVKWRR